MIQDNEKVTLIKRILGNAVADVSLNISMPNYSVYADFYDDAERYSYETTKNAAKNGSEVKHGFIPPFNLKDIELPVNEAGILNVIKGARTKFFVKVFPPMPIREVEINTDEEIFVNCDRQREGVFVLTGRDVGIYPLRIKVHNVEKNILVKVNSPEINGVEIMDVNESLEAVVNSDVRQTLEVLHG